MARRARPLAGPSTARSGGAGRRAAGGRGRPGCRAPVHRRDGEFQMAAAGAHRLGGLWIDRGVGLVNRGRGALRLAAPGRGARLRGRGGRRRWPGGGRRRVTSRRQPPRRASHRQPHRGPGGDGRRGRRAGQPVLSVLGQHERRRDHSGELLPDQRGVRPLPQGPLRPVELVDAPLLVVQQPVVPQIDRVHAGRRRHQAVEVVRRLSRSRRVLQRTVRPADQGADRHAGSAGGPRVHVVPRDHARQEHDGPGGLRRRVSAAARPGGEREPAAAVRARSAPLHGSAAAPRDVPQAVPPRADAGILLVVSQGAPRRAGERLSLVPRLQRLRQLAGVRHLGRGRAIVLLPAEIAEVRRLPHAARALDRSGGEERDDPVAPLRGGEHGGAVRQRRYHPARGSAEIPARRPDYGRRLRPGPRTRGDGRIDGACGRRAAARQHVCRGRRIGQLRRRAGGAATGGGGARAARSRGRVGTARRIHPRRGRRPDAQGRPLLPGRHRRCLRCLGRVRGRGRCRPRDPAQRRARRQRRPRREGRALLPVPAPRRTRQRDQQAQCVCRAIGRLRPARASRCGGHRALPARSAEGRARQCAPAREGELPQVHVVEHAVCVRRREGSCAGTLLARPQSRRWAMALHGRYEATSPAS